jgi:hypothetical protein
VFLLKLRQIRRIAIDYPEACKAIHLNYIFGYKPPDDGPESQTDGSKRFFEFERNGRAYSSDFERPILASLTVFAGMQGSTPYVGLAFGSSRTDVEDRPSAPRSASTSLR